MLIEYTDWGGPALVTVGMLPTVLIANSDMGNVPQDFPFDKAFFGDLYNDAAQFYYK